MIRIHKQLSQVQRAFLLGRGRFQKAQECRKGIASVGCGERFEHLFVGDGRGIGNDDIKRSVLLRHGIFAVFIGTHGAEGGSGIAGVIHPHQLGSGLVRQHFNIGYAACANGIIDVNMA